MNRMALAIGALLLTISCTQTVIQRGLDHSQASEAMAALSQNGLHPSIRREGKDGYAVAVPDGESSRAAAVLRRKGFPKRTHRGLEALSEGDSLVPRPGRDRLNYYAAMADTLESTLESLPGVLSASVHLALGFDTTGDPMPPTGASVVLQVNGEDFSLTEHQIVDTVAGAFPSMGRNGVRLVVVTREFPPLPPVNRSFWNELLSYLPWLLSVLLGAGLVVCASRKAGQGTSSSEDEEQGV